MSSPFATYPTPERSFIPQGHPSTAAARGGAPVRGTGAKRGRKPKNAASTTASPRVPAQEPLPSTSTSQTTETQWINTTAGAASTSSAAYPPGQQPQDAQQAVVSSESGSVLDLPGVTPAAPNAGAADVTQPRPAPGAVGEEDGEGEDEVLPAMADDDYSAQLSWQSQSKDNLKVLMDNFSPDQYDRFEAYRRHALPKQAVRKVYSQYHPTEALFIPPQVIQQTLGQQVSQPVAQIVAGFAKVFVGEMVEKARAVQERRGETGPLSPDHLREAYRLYQHETGRVGAARPLRGKKLFVK
ncbi:TAFII28-domain-containing protein [Obba rivulosa]|uniref:TAFII28-domain-containing protein n=1 Tax=Obba rivulosa TaxID=1052685 RepID=A0A8E2AMA1_9APHY|nr:TAFII28-domain-containing protein [Obba rivulosa]